MDEQSVAISWDENKSTINISHNAEPESQYGGSIQTRFTGIVEEKRIVLNGSEQQYYMDGPYSYAYKMQIILTRS